MYRKLKYILLFLCLKLYHHRQHLSNTQHEVWYSQLHLRNFQIPVYMKQYKAALVFLLNFTNFNIIIYFVNNILYSKQPKIIKREVQPHPPALSKYFKHRSMTLSRPNPEHDESVNKAIRHLNISLMIVSASLAKNIYYLIFIKSYYIFVKQK